MAKKKTPRQTVIEELKTAIRNSGLGVRGLARASGVEPSAISRFMRDERSIDLHAASAICEALHLHLATDEPASA